jgi:AraC-like DNA-binding protein
MDVLSDVIALMRTGTPHSARVGWRAPWAQRFAPVPGAAGFQVVLHGSCWLIPAEAFPPVRLGEGDVVLLPFGPGHVLADHPSRTPTAEACAPGEHPLPPPVENPDTVTLCGAYQLDAARAHPLLLDLPGVVHLPAHAAQHTGLRAAVGLLCAELERPGPGTDAVVPSLLDALLLYILRGWLADVPRTPTGWAAALNDPAIAVALASMHQHPGDPWTVASLASAAGMSRAPFAGRFATLLGRPPLTYLTWWRMTVAARLLHRSDALLGAIAAQVGYTSEFAFATAFKRHHGISPGRYRRISTVDSSAAFRLSSTEGQ